MGAIELLVQALGVAFASAINLPAAVSILGLAQVAGWVAPYPGALSALGHPLVISVALFLTVVQFGATLIPGIASLWETVQTAIRPPAAAVLAIATVYQLDPAVIAAAGLLGGTLALSAHGAKLGLRYAVDTSPEPVTNGIANIAELGFVASLCVGIWHHPYLTLSIALLVLALLILVVRRITKAIRGLFRTSAVTSTAAVDASRRSALRR